MIDLLDLRFSAGESLLAGCVVGIIVWTIARLLSRLLAMPTPTITKAAPRTVIEFPPQPTHFLRDIEPEEAPDALFDTTLLGYIRHAGPEGEFKYYRGRMLVAIEAARRPDGAIVERKVRHYAQMTASRAFALHPELREERPVAVVTWPHGSRRFINGYIVH